jgi:hypothetical protein
MGFSELWDSLRKVWPRREVLSCGRWLVGVFAERRGGRVRS